MSKPFIEYGLRLEKIRLAMRYTQQEFANFAEISLRCCVLPPKVTTQYRSN